MNDINNTQKTVESRKVTLEGVRVVNVSSPSTIQRVAVDRGLNPQEVFVRCTFEYEGNQFTASNKLRFLTKAGYNELLDAKANGTLMTFTVDVDKEFFYIEHDVNVDDLFAEEVTPVEDSRQSLVALLG